MFDSEVHTEKERNLKLIELRTKALQQMLWLASKMPNLFQPIDIQLMIAELAKLKKETEDINNQPDDKSLLQKLGINLEDKEIQAVGQAAQITIGHINEILQAKIEAAERALELASGEREAAEQNLQNEIEARNAGYANSVDTARKELIAKRRAEKQAEREKEKAVRAQQKMDMISQTSSLITASAKIWSALGEIPPLAVAAIGMMWGSFIAAKTQAAKVTKIYRKGGAGILAGGSHESGKDTVVAQEGNISHRAERGEGFIVVRKEQARKQKKDIYSVAEALNNGTFKDRYSERSNKPFSRTMHPRLKGNAIYEKRAALRGLMGQIGTVPQGGIPITRLGAIADGIKKYEQVFLTQQEMGLSKHDLRDIEKMLSQMLSRPVTYTDALGRFVEERNGRKRIYRNV
jgi:hypothetical protein